MGPVAATRDDKISIGIDLAMLLNYRCTPYYIYCIIHFVHFDILWYRYILICLLQLFRARTWQTRKLCRAFLPRRRVGLLGCGAFGAVELVEHTGLGDTYALKAQGSGLLGSELVPITTMLKCCHSRTTTTRQC